jgi:hypothetical protein
MKLGLETVEVVEVAAKEARKEVPSPTNLPPAIPGAHPLVTVLSLADKLYSNRGADSLTPVPDARVAHTILG